MSDKPELYFKTHFEWRSWLEINYNTSNGLYLILFKVESNQPSMRWEEAVKVALCFGWIDSTVQNWIMNADDNIFALEIQKVFGVKLIKPTLKI